jgi:hypothetical protein
MRERKLHDSLDLHFAAFIEVIQERIAGQIEEGDPDLYSP